MIKHFISTLLARFQSEDEEGQTLVEYGLLLALIAIIVIVALLFLGPIVSEIFQNVGTTLEGLIPTSDDARTPVVPPGRRGSSSLRRPLDPSVVGADLRRQYHHGVAHKSTREGLPGVRRLLTAVTTLRCSGPHSVLITRAKGDSL